MASHRRRNRNRRAWNRAGDRPEPTQLTADHPHHDHALHLHRPSARIVLLFLGGLVSGLLVTWGLSAIYTDSDPQARRAIGSLATAVSQLNNRPAPVTEPAALTVSATLDENRFEPRVMTIEAGTRVTWTNREKAQHNIKLPGKRSTPLFGHRSSFSHTFAKAGTFHVTCPIHPGMATTVHVVAAPA